MCGGGVYIARFYVVNGHTMEVARVVAHSWCYGLPVVMTFDV